MDATYRFRVNTPRVIHEPFETEVVIVNLDTGRYYCLQGSGPELWTYLTNGATARDIVRGFEHNYEAADGEIQRGVDQFLEELVREELIVPAPGEHGSSAEHAADSPSDTNREKRKFATPSLQMYTDMQDLLLLDPIHEVDERGWPSATGE